jgi:hypothetical protein
MLRTGGTIVGIFAIALLVSAVTAVSCSRFWTGTLSVRNESAESVDVKAGAGREVAVGAGTSQTIKLGLFWGRWAPPGSVLIGDKECLWSEVKNNEPLVITDDGALCEDIYPDVPGGFNP